MSGPSRVVHCRDALGWLSEGPLPEAASYVTSLPDRSELPGLSEEAWRGWFTEAAERVLRACADQGVAIFYQTDVKRQGRWVDKGQLVQRAAEREGSLLLWHKVVCRQPPGTVTHGRAGYAHLLCFSRGQRLDLSRASADVLQSRGEVLWTRGMPFDTCLFCCRYVRDQTPTRTVVDPFCGKGTVLAAANAVGLDAVGVELARKRAQAARTFSLTP